jgi:hypothetical protein
MRNVMRGILDDANMGGGAERQPILTLTHLEDEFVGHAQTVGGVS